MHFKIMMSTIKDCSVQIFQRIGYRLLSPTCIICRLPSQSRLDLCEDCARTLPRLNHRCEQCGLPLEQAAQQCGQCLQHPLTFDRTIVLYDYATPVDRLIHELKFKHRLVNAAILGQLLARKLHDVYQQQARPELIIPIPLHKKRLRERGFNQALEIARPISRHLKIPLDKFRCQRIRNTPPQSQLTAKERRSNVRNAFAIHRLQAKHVAVLDDVMTTATTMNEFCASLRQAGVEQIDVWCIARTNLR